MIKSLIIPVVLSVFAGQMARAQGSKNHGSIVVTDSLPSSGSKAKPAEYLAGLIQLPIGEFSNSHYAGFALEYSRTSNQTSNTTKSQPVDWILKGSAEYFIGKKEPEEGYEFRYSNYGYATIMGGLIYSPISKANIYLTAGPGAGIYLGAARLGINAAAGINISLNNQWSVGPTATFRKHNNTNSLWTAGIKVGRTLK